MNTLSSLEAKGPAFYEVGEYNEIYFENGTLFRFMNVSNHPILK